MIIFILIIIILSIIFFASKNKPSQSSICAKEICFSVEIAKTNAERKEGLMGRSYLEENQGMLFVFEGSGIYGFWMKDTLIPLDIAWLDKQGKLINYVSVHPCTEAECPVYSSNQPATYVLELNAGTLSKYNISKGDAFTMFINS